MKTALANSSGAKTARFLVHCVGRRTRNRPEAGWASPPPERELRGGDAEVDEATFTHPGRVEDVPAIEDHRLSHQLLHPVEVRPAELVPLGEDEEPVRLLQGLVGV
jgi:hypothetical protein